MSQTLLKKILLSEACVDIEKIIKFLQLFKLGDYIYPSVFKRNLKCSAEETYKILLLLEKNHFLKMVYIIECYSCDKEIARYEEFNQIDEIYCDQCDEKLSFPENVKVVFRVVKKWKI